MLKPHGQGDRLYALDNLRAIMMWLGIVLHVAAIYMVGESPLPWRDGHTSLAADLLTVWIHAFRMPVFFILAGFFVLLLAQRRGWRGMLRNRLLRLGLPFAVLWPVIFGLTIVMALLFAYRAVHGTWGLDETLVVPPAGVPLINTMHLWFLWQLVWFCVLAGVLAPMAQWVPATVRSGVSAVFVRVACGPWGFAVLAVPLALLGANYKYGVLMVSGSFLPPLAEWLHHGLFYVFGLALYGQRSRILALYQQHWPAYAAAGAVLFVGVLVLGDPQRNYIATLENYTFWFSLLYNSCTWLWCFALIGAFLRHLGQPQGVLTYLSQSAYWVYLIHLPLTVLFGACLYAWEVSALVKMPVNIVLTTVVAVVSYHLLVRSTGLGALLNGKRYPFAIARWRR